MFGFGSKKKKEDKEEEDRKKLVDARSNANPADSSDGNDNLAQALRAMKAQNQKRESESGVKLGYEYNDDGDQVDLPDCYYGVWPESIEIPKDKPTGKSALASLQV